MRLWSIDPRYLDPQGLVALWREALLAQAVLAGRTRGYRSHPQLERFRAQAKPGAAIAAYLRAIHAEATSRAYSFDERKIGQRGRHAPIRVTSGQLQFEWQHLLAKLAVRNPALHRQWRDVAAPACHPLFSVCAGGVESWERAAPP